VIKISLRFPAGRFHATPWGRHVNEGPVEWPPSPWRFLRGLIATWHLKLKNGTEDDTVLRTLITKFAATLPVYQLPQASSGHTRHYMPINEGRAEKRTKVFDTFLHPADALKIAWDLDLDGNERALLASLLKNLNYFGRAESLVEARLLNVSETFEPNARPLAEDAAPGKAEELVRLLTPLSPDVYENWRAQRQSAGNSEPVKPKTPKRTSRKTVTQDLPSDIFEALLADTGELQRAGWNLPPGSQLVNYTRPERIFDIEPIRQVIRARRSRPTVARYALASAVLPQMTQSISVAERVHQSLVAFSDGAAVFTGCDANKQPMTGHRHVHIFCEAGQRTAIRHVTLYAPMGFDTGARDALKRLRKVWGHGGHDLQLVLLGIGDCDDFAGKDGCLLFETSTTWKSLTPFVPTRHPKNHRDGRPKLDDAGWHIGSPEHELRRLISERGDLPLPQKIQRLRVIECGSRSLRCIQFQRERKHGYGVRAGEFGYSFRLVFPQPVRGPLAFGYGAHFGLGLFVPVDS